jgi:cell division protein ZapA
VGIGPHRAGARPIERAAARGRRGGELARSRAHLHAAQRVEGAIGEIDRSSASRRSARADGQHRHRIAGANLRGCRDGEEEHLRSVGPWSTSARATRAQALGSLSEARLLLFTSLMLADELKELQEGGSPASAAPPPPADDVAQAAEMMAERMEALADRLEQGS